MHSSSKSSSRHRSSSIKREKEKDFNSNTLTVLVSFFFGFVNWTLYWRSPCPGICFKGDHSTKHPSSVMLLTLGAAKKKCIFRRRRRWWWCKECIYFVLCSTLPLVKCGLLSKMQSMIETYRFIILLWKKKIMNNRAKNGKNYIFF